MTRGEREISCGKCGYSFVFDPKSMKSDGNKRFRDCKYATTRNCGGHLKYDCWMANHHCKSCVLEYQEEHEKSVEAVHSLFGFYTGKTKEEVAAAMIGT